MHAGSVTPSLAPVAWLLSFGLGALGAWVGFRHKDSTWAVLHLTVPCWVFLKIRLRMIINGHTNWTAL